MGNTNKHDYQCTALERECDNTSRENKMRKAGAVLFTLVCIASITGCGGSSSTTATTNYDVTTPVPAASAPGTPLGGAIQGKQLVLTNPASVATFAGSSAGFNNVSTAGSATFNRPLAVTTDGTNLYVADYMNNAIRQINIATQHVTTIAGNTAGLAGSADGTGNAASFNLPRDITTDGTNLYVADSGNYTIRKIVLVTGVVTTLAGAVGTIGSVDAAIGTNARFNVLNGITTDGNNLYVTDSNNTIRKIVLATTTVTTLAGTPGTSGSTDGTQAAARFNLPQHLTTDGPNLYVTDFSNSTIRKIALATGAVTTIAGKVEPGGATGVHADSTDGTGLTARFNQPNGITTDGFNLYVTDSYDNMVRKIVFPAPGAEYSGPVTTLANNGAANVTSTVGISTDGLRVYLTDISTDLATGNLQHRIRRIE
jgi:sugar lactone lactonase YvrE